MSTPIQAQQDELVQTRARLAGLIEINQLLMGTVEAEDLLRAILSSAIRLFSAQGCSLGLVDEAAGQLAFTTMEGEARVEEFRIDLGQGIAGLVARTGQPLVSNDVSTDPRWFGGVDQKTGFHTTSILCVPLKRRGRIIGVIEALNTTKAEGFSQADMELLLAFGSLAATALSRARAFTTVRNAKVAFQEVIQDRYHLIAGPSSSMEEVLRLARTTAATPSTVLLLGESGTGKEVLARAIHQWSPRADHPFIAVNCTALSPELLENELFGHERGAFTGATGQKKGRFELADGGTIFLDEIGDLAPDLQVKLLRVLQEREFQRLGGTREIRVDVRILAATNRNLQQAMQTGGFRQDLYYRLNVVSMTLPALRDRRADIPGLVQHFLERSCREMKRPQLGLDPAVLPVLHAYPWPGNVRELQNALERAVVLATGPDVGIADLPAEIRSASRQPSNGAPPPEAPDDSLPLSDAVEEFKRLRVRHVLEQTDWNQTEAARRLGLPQSNLSRLMKRLGLRS